MWGASQGPSLVETDGWQVSVCRGRLSHTRSSKLCRDPMVLAIRMGVGGRCQRCWDWGKLHPHTRTNEPSGNRDADSSTRR